MEEFVTGYCRVLDSTRTVLVDLDEHCADCDYLARPYAVECPVAEKITHLLQES